MDTSFFTVRVGDTKLYGPRHCTSEETYNITIRNICSRAGSAAIALTGEIGNLIVENIECFDGTELLLDKRDHGI